MRALASRMNIRPVIRFGFTLCLAIVISFAFVGLISLLPWFAFEWEYVIASTIGILIFGPRSNISWGIAYKEYGDDSVKLHRAAMEPGFLKENAIGDEGLFIFTSLADEGLILSRPHLAPILRETVLIPWEKLSVRRVRLSKELKEGELQDQTAPMIAEIRIRGLTYWLEIPWNKELELYTNFRMQDLA